ncbi:MAG TPA: hypothetical protein PKH81_09325 [Treponemataceae bacterium]|nr:hypothetical protein [Treponemataceae bacterium]
MIESVFTRRYTGFVVSIVSGIGRFQILVGMAISRTSTFFPATNLVPSG